MLAQQAKILDSLSYWIEDSPSFFNQQLSLDVVSFSQ